MRSSRTKTQETAMQGLYTALTYIDMKETIPVEEIVSNLSGLPYEESDYYLKAVLVLALTHLDELVKEISPLLNRWTFWRLNRVAQAILLLAYTQFYYVEPGVDKAIVINNAVKLAKNYLDKDDYRFVNAVLDNGLKEALDA